jgi:hypothetical protein
MATSTFDRNIIVQSKDAARVIFNELSKKPKDTKQKHNLGKEFNKGVKILRARLSRLES